MFWLRPPVASKQAVNEEVQLPPVSGSPATSAPSLSDPVVSVPRTASRWSVQTASIVEPRLAAAIYLVILPSARFQ